MRWKAADFWSELGDVLPSEDGLMSTSHDLLWATFTAGAREAEVLPAHPEPGFATVRVSGLGWWARWRLRLVLNEDKRRPITTSYLVEKLTREEAHDG